MANVLPDDRDIIEKFPLDNTLDHLQVALRQAEQSYRVDGDNSDQALRKAASGLLGALIGSEVSGHLGSRTGNREVATDLLGLRRRMQKGDFNYEHYRALVRLVIRNASDVDIWSAVFNLIITISRFTPPTSIAPSFDGTPITHSSASQQGSEQTEKLLRVPIFHEIMKCTYRGVGGFFQKYFEGKKWTKRGEDIYNSMKSRHVDGRWIDFPDPPLEGAVSKWLFRFQDEFMADARGIYYTSSSSADFTGAEAPRQLDLFVKRKAETDGMKHNWKDVHVVGEHKQSKDGPKSLLLQLSRYMRDVFTAQPTRRFIHGFFLYGTLMELWVVDRSGPYSSGSFDIHEKPKQFIQAIAGYAMMDDEELGLDTFVKRDGEDQFISIIEDATGKEKRLQLEREPIVIQRAIVCRGTSCYRSMDLKYVIKFSWTSDKRTPEADHLRLAREKGVKGVVSLLGHRQITSVEEMRKGLTFPPPHHFRITSPKTSFSQSQSQPVSRSFGPFRGLGIVEGLSRKRKSVDDEAKKLKRSRSNSQKSKLNEQHKVQQALTRAQTSLFASNDGSFEKRLFCCLAISPAGEAISKFDSIEELLAALRDSIKAHKSLYIQGKILHRDISENNIIITNPDKADGFTGMLIDLDLAKAIGSGRSGARHQTGTMEFMAIEVLQRVAHTYRYDLESFFYVLLWICARRAWDREFHCNLTDRPTRNILRKWYTGDYDDIADVKQGYMHADGFEKILDEFPWAFDGVKPLCRTIRGILFPLLESGGLNIGTPAGPPEKLYDSIIKVFDVTIADIAAGQNSG